MKEIKKLIGGGTKSSIRNCILFSQQNFSGGVAYLAIPKQSEVSIYYEDIF